jgi:hypothetical protein
MKRTFTLIISLLILVVALAQPPQKMSYQAVIRNASNQLVSSHAVGMRVSILQGSATGIALFVETHTATTNSNGLVTIEIGGGTPVTGTFEGINWSAGTFFIKTESDPTGGTNYTITGTSQVLSVPFALYSKSSESIYVPNVTYGDLLFYDGTKWTRLPKGSSGQILATSQNGQLKWYNMFSAPTATADTTFNSTMKVELYGTVNPKLLPTTATFEYGTSLSYGTIIPAEVSPLTGIESVSVKATTPAVQTNVTYHFRVKAENEFGITYSNDKTFKISCMICKQVTYQNGNIVNAGTPTEYCGTDLETVLSIPPVVIGPNTIVWECNNK